MPIVQITLVAGRDDAIVKHCIKEVARVIHQTLDAPLETVRVIVQQVPSHQFAIGDRTRDEIDLAKKGAGA
jgi:4-oxalocrotonate tautomerase